MRPRARAFPPSSEGSKGSKERKGVGEDLPSSVPCVALPPRGPGQPLSDSPLAARQVAPPDLAAQTSPMPLCAPALMSTSSPGMACPGPGPSARRPARTSQRTRKGKGEAGMWPRRVQWVPTDVGVRKCVDGRHGIEWNGMTAAPPLRRWRSWMGPPTHARVSPPATRTTAHTARRAQAVRPQRPTHTARRPGRRTPRTSVRLLSLRCLDVGPPH